MLGFVEMMDYRESVLSNKSLNPSVAEKLKNGAKIKTNGIYLCPKCKDFKNSNIYFLLENFTTSPYGTVRYDVYFLLAILFVIYVTVN